MKGWIISRLGVLLLANACVSRHTACRDANASHDPDPSIEKVSFQGKSGSSRNEPSSNDAGGCAKVPPIRPNRNRRFKAMLVDKVDNELECPHGTRRIPGGKLRIEEERYVVVTPSGKRQDLPPRFVSVSPFCLDIHEVTRAELQEAGLAADSGARGSQLPALVRYETAHRYCQAREARLPKKSEWILAAVGQLSSRFPWGDSIPESGVCWRRPTGSPLCEVGVSALDRNPQGVFDLIANAQEWVVAEDSTEYEWALGVKHDDCLAPLLASSLKLGQRFALSEHAVNGFRCVREALEPSKGAVSPR